MALLALASPLALFLEPVGEGVAQGVSDDKCVAELQAALTGRKWRVVATAEEADARIEIRDCVVRVRSRLKSKTKSTGVDIPGPQHGPGHPIIPGGPRAVGSEQEYGANMEEERLVLLRVRLSSGDRFAEVSSDPRDEHLKQAAATVAKHAGTWLAEVKPHTP